MDVKASIELLTLIVSFKDIDSNNSARDYGGSLMVGKDTLPF